MTDNTLFPDNYTDFDAEARKLARRRQIAEQLIGTPMAPSVIMAGRVPIANFAGAFDRFNQQTQGNREMDAIDAADKLLSANQAANSREVMIGLTTKGSKQQLRQGEGALLEPNVDTVDLSPEEESQRRLRIMGKGMSNPTLRQTLAAQLGQEMDWPQRQAEAEAKRRFDAEQKELDRIEKGEQSAADRVAREDLRRIPSQHITIRTGGDSQSNPFGGASTQVGTDKDGNPVYRVTKTGGIYKFSPDGQPVAHDGAILPKPPLQDAATRKTLHEASLGIQGVDDALAKLQHPKATGATGPVNVLPGSELVRQYTDTPEAIDARAAISNIGSLKLHDRSGAAVTVSEFPRLAPFIPKVSDSPVAAKRKLDNLKSEYERMQAEWSGKPMPPKVVQPTVVREVKLKDGRIGVEYSDGTRGYK